MLPGTGWDCWGCPVQGQGLNSMMLVDAFLLRLFRGPGWVECCPDTLSVCVMSLNVPSVLSPVVFGQRNCSKLEPLLGSTLPADQCLSPALASGLFACLA